MHWVNQIGWSGIVSLVGALIVALGAVLSALDQNRSTANLAQKNEEIARLSLQISNSVTGGSATCHFVCTSGVCLLFSTSNSPMYDVQASVVADETVRTDGSSKDDKLIRVGNLPPYDGAGPFSGFLNPSRDAGHWLIAFKARNGHFHQELFVQQIQGKWEHATRVGWVINTSGASGIAYENITPGYPRQSDGSVKFKYIRDDWGVKKSQ